MKLSDLILTPASAIIICIGIALSIAGGFLLKPHTTYWGLLAVGLFFAFTVSAFTSLYRTVKKRNKEQ